MLKIPLEPLSYNIIRPYSYLAHFEFSNRATKTHKIAYHNEKTEKKSLITSLRESYEMALASDKAP